VEVRFLNDQKKVVRWFENRLDELMVEEPRLLIELSSCSKLTLKVESEKLDLKNWGDFDRDWQGTSVEVEDFEIGKLGV